MKLSDILVGDKFVFNGSTNQDGILYPEFNSLSKGDTIEVIGEGIDNTYQATFSFPVLLNGVSKLKLNFEVGEGIFSKL